MKRATFLLLFFLALKFTLQYLAIHPGFELHRDEFLHLDQAKHLAWGYLSVPPMTSWISYIIEILGGGEFWVRFFPAFFGALTIALVWDLVKKLGGNLFAQCLAAMALLCSALVRINLLFQPNSIDILCYTLVFYTLIRFVQTNKTPWLYLLGLSFGIGFLNKYNIAFLGLGLLPALLITRPKLFQNIHLLGALAVTVLLILPNLVWQYQHGFPVATHMRLLSKYQLVNNSRMGFLTEQFLFFYPSLTLWVIGWIGTGFSQKLKEFRFLFWAYLFTIGIFTFLQAKAYYAIGLYPVYLGIGAILVSDWIYALLGKKTSTETSRLSLAGFTPNRLTMIQTIVLLIPPALFYLAFPLIHPVYSPEEIQKSPPPYSKLGLNRWEDGKEYPIPQDFADMLGWQELATLVDSAYALMPEGRTMIICDNYGEAGAINFYSKTPGLEALTMNADYLYWFDLSEPVDNLILVWEKNEQITAREIGFFEEYREIGKITQDMAREKGTTVHWLRGARGNINAVLEGEIKEEKQLWESIEQTDK